MIIRSTEECVGALERLASTDPLLFSRVPIHSKGRGWNDGGWGADNGAQTRGAEPKDAVVIRRSR